MNILISNDDGINSEGLKALVDKFALKHNVLVVAPDGNRTASSHSLSIGKKIKLKNVDKLKNCLAYSLSGTPADCVKFAKLHFNYFNPDVVLAGINSAHNLGSDILYSGTVSLACEAAFFGNVAFAFSAFSFDICDLPSFADYALQIVEKLLPLSSSGEVWNVNFPNINFDLIKGVKITPLGKQLYTDRYVNVGKDEYKLVGELIDHNQNEPDCDIEWIKKGYVTITPILLNKTDNNKIEKIKDKCEKLL